MKEVYDFLKKAQTYYLATVEDGQPKVRPFGTIDIFDGKLTFQTGKVKKVSNQLHADPHFEICAFCGGEWLRLSGEAYELDSLEAQTHMLDSYPELKAMYAPGDGNTEIFEIRNARAVFSSFTAPERTVEF